MLQLFLPNSMHSLPTSHVWQMRMIIIAHLIPVIIANRRTQMNRGRFWQGSDTCHLLSLTSATAAPIECSVRMALLNTRSITNKSFILKELFISKNMDFLFLAETWLSPRLSSRGRRLAVIFRNCFHCLTVSTETFPHLNQTLLKLISQSLFVVIHYFYFLSVIFSCLILICSYPQFLSLTKFYYFTPPLGLNLIFFIL